MGAIGFLGPFLEYLRPTKSPYLLIATVAVMLICASLNGHEGVSLYRPGFFIPLYSILIVILPLSLSMPATLVSQGTTENPARGQVAVGLDASRIDNFKFENDAESVFKFSRGMGVVSGIVMMFFYFEKDQNWSPYAWIGYGVIIVHTATFMALIAFKHVRGEDISNNNLFQVAFLTATFFCGGTYAALHVEWDNVAFMYRCHYITILYNDGHSIMQPCDVKMDVNNLANNTVPIYRPDFRQITVLVFITCWIVYEIFWIGTIVNLFKSKPFERKEPSLGPPDAFT